MMGEPKASESKQGSAMSAGEIAEVADTNEAPRQYVLAKAAQELGRSESHDALFVAVSIVFPSETHVLPIEVKQALVADGHAMGVAAKIAQHMSRSTERGLGIDHPRML